MQSPAVPPTALLVGTEDMLLFTRKSILERQHFSVSISSPTQAPDTLRSSDFDVVIACHTLIPEEAALLVETARAKSKVPALIGFTKHPSPRPAPLFDVTIWSLASPETFVRKVHEALRSDPS